MTISGRLYFLSVIILTLSCKSTRLSAPTLTEFQNIKFVQVDLKELLQDKGKFHGQMIETSGELTYGFEDLSIHYYDEIQNGDTVTKVKNYIGLGLKLHPDMKLNNSYLKSINHRKITARGVFDTMNYEKVSGLPDKGLLRNVYYFQVVDR